MTIQSEVLFRQGTWVTQHRTFREAIDWNNAVCHNEWDTVNPARDGKVFDTSERDPLPPPTPPAQNADQLLTDEEFWNK